MNTLRALYTLTGEETNEQFHLLVIPESRRKVTLLLYQGDRHDPSNPNKALSGPMKWTESRDRKAFYEKVREVFDRPEEWWVELLLTHLATAHVDLVEAYLQKIKDKTVSQPDVEPLKGHEPTIYKTPSGYLIEGESSSLLIPLSNFTASIVQDLLLDDGVEQKRTYTLECLLHGEYKRLPPISAASFKGLSWVDPFLGSLASHEGGKAKQLTVKAIRLQSRDTMQRIHAYSHTGWRQLIPDDPSGWVFLDGSGAIGSCLGRLPFEVAVRLDEGLGSRSLPSAPPQQVRESLRKSLLLWDLVPDRVGIPLFLSIYRAALGNPDYSVFLLGPTGIGKTPLARIMNTHFGARDISTRDGSETGFESTSGSIEQLAFILKDEAVLADDYIGKPEEPRHEPTMRFIGRVAANGIGRGRLAPDLTAVPGKPPRSLVVVTGERLPQGRSLRARMLVLALEKGMGPKVGKGSPLSAAVREARAGSYALVMREFISRLAPRYGRFRETIAPRRDSYAERVQAMKSHNRTPHVYGDLRLALDEFLDFAEELDAISSFERSSLQNRAEKAALAGFLDQAKYLGPADPVEQYRELLNEAIASGRAYIATSEHPDGEGELLGWVVEGREGIFLIPRAFMKVARAISKETGISFVATREELHYRLHSGDWLLSTDLHKRRKSRATRVHVDGVQRTVLHLRSGFVDVEEG
jgi:hypothetical protein